MYPSAKHPSYGIFVKNSEDILLEGGFEISQKAVISGKGRNIAEKIIKYSKFYWRILWQGFISDHNVIYVHYISHAAIPVLFLKFFTKKKLILNVHGTDVISQRNFDKLLFPFSKILCKNADLIVSPSEYFKNTVIEKFKVSGEKIFVYPSGGIDLEIFKKADYKRISKKFILGFVSRLDAGKGWDLYLKALFLLKTKNPDIDFQGLVIGDGNEKKLFLEMMKNLSLEENITYVGGKSQKELPYYYNQMDVFIFPSVLAESLGLVGLEALACKIPVIGSNRGGCLEYVFDNQNGYLFEAGKHEDLTAKIMKYFRLSALEKLEMKEKAYEVALGFEKNAVAKNLFEQLNKIN